MRFQLTNKAYTDLKNIAKYTPSTWGIEQRKEYLARLDQAFHMIAENSGIGRNCDNIRKGYYSYPAGRHLVFYRIEDKAVTIVRILHQSMDVEQQL